MFFFCPQPSLILTCSHALIDLSENFFPNCSCLVGSLFALAMKAFKSFFLHFGFHVLSRGNLSVRTGGTKDPRDPNHNALFSPEALLGQHDQIIQALLTVQSVIFSCRSTGLYPYRKRQSCKCIVINSINLPSFYKRGGIISMYGGCD